MTDASPTSMRMAQVSLTTITADDLELLLVTVSEFSGTDAVQHRDHSVRGIVFDARVTALLAGRGEHQLARCTA